MDDAGVQEPEAFIAVLRRFHTAEGAQQGALADTLSEWIIRKRVDLAQVRLALMDQRAEELLGALDALLDLIEPYIEEGGVDE